MNLSDCLLPESFLDVVKKKKPARERVYAVLCDRHINKKLVSIVLGVDLTPEDAWKRMEKKAEKHPDAAFSIHAIEKSDLRIHPSGFYYVEPKALAEHATMQVEEMPSSDMSENEMSDFIREFFSWVNNEDR